MSNMTNQFIRIESEMFKVYFKTVMQNVLGVTTEDKQVGIFRFVFPVVFLQNGGEGGSVKTQLS